MEPKTENKPEETKVEGQKKELTEKQLAKQAKKDAAKEKAAAKEAAAKEKAAKGGEKDGEKASKAKSKTTAITATKTQEEEKEMDLETAIKLKKDLSAMAEKYDPRAVEKYWYQWWKDNKFWHADVEKAVKASWDEKFTIVLPPPNVTGYLHIGHALMLTVEDAICRW